MDAITNWASSIVTAHPKIAVWLMLIVGVDNFVLKIVGPFLKAKFGISLPDNLADTIGNFISKVLSGSTLPKQ